MPYVWLDLPISVMGYSIAEVAKITGVAPQTVRDYIRDGTLTAQKIGRNTSKLMISRLQLEKVFPEFFPPLENTN